MRITVSEKVFKEMNLELGEINATKQYIKEMYKKLAQLEDIEEELGIDLITFFKAITNGFYGTMYAVSKEYANAQNWEPMFYELKNTDIKKYDGKLAVIHYLGRLSYADFLVYEFKDYGKTWALTKEELL